MKLSAAYASRPCAGHTENGDAAVVRRWAGWTLLAVVDALGHGPVAAAVAKRATEFLESAPVDGALGDGARLATALMEGLDRALHGTRGAAATLCLSDGVHLWGCGVGNVELRSVGGRLPAVISPGVIGGRVRGLRVFDAPLQSGQRLALFSDGITRRVDLDRTRDLPAEDACARILAESARDHDDATILLGDLSESR